MNLIAEGRTHAAFGGKDFFAWVASRGTEIIPSRSHFVNRRECSSVFFRSASESFFVSSGIRDFLSKEYALLPLRVFPRLRFLR